MLQGQHATTVTNDPGQFDPRTYRKLVRHFDEPGHAHELTFSCFRRLRLLTIDPRRCELLSEAIDRAMTKHGFELVAFVYMPEHVHLIVFPVRPDATIAQLLFAIKRPFSQRVKRLLGETDTELVAKLTIQERPGKTAFRFWQEGGGYDRNIRNLKTLKLTVDYVHNNPLRRGLCATPADWWWSSWKFYAAPQHWSPEGLPTMHGFPAS